jgi:hypothetical protein
MQYPANVPFSATTIKVTSFLFCYCVFFLLSTCHRAIKRKIPVSLNWKQRKSNGYYRIQCSFGEELSFKGRFEISSKGFCWSQDKDPDVSGNHTEEGKGDAPFVSI